MIWYFMPHTQILSESTGGMQGRRDAGPADCTLVPADLEIPEIRRGNCVSQMRGAAMLRLMKLPGSNMFWKNALAGL